jgi:hypothetical protein
MPMAVNPFRKNLRMVMPPLAVVDPLRDLFRRRIAWGAGGVGFRFHVAAARNIAGVPAVAIRPQALALLQECLLPVGLDFANLFCPVARYHRDYARSNTAPVQYPARAVNPSLSRRP